EFPADGTAKAASISSTSFYYLFNADIACAASVPQPPPVATPSPSPTPTPVPTPTAPSNVFRVVGLKKSTLSVSLASPGVLTATEAPAKGKKTAPRLLKPSSATGGPGTATLKLALTGAAKAMLRETGKVKVRTTLAFTPTGGSTAVQLRVLTVKRSVKHPTRSSLALLAAPSVAGAALPTTTDTLIVPAKSIAGVALGASAKSVIKAWGKDEGCEYQCIYEGAAGKDETPSLAGVLLEKSAAGSAKVWSVYIDAGQSSAGGKSVPDFDTPLSRFKTAKGIGLGATVGELKRAYRAAKKEGSTVLFSYTLKGPKESATTFSFGAEGRIIGIAVRSHPAG
ncbi:MAG: hypothetical protein JST59_11730, partial [Actinobacteria bacterium]|nr:hypothetical protein [Actinomycetota bacterium]